MLNKGSDSTALHKDPVVDSRDILLDKPRFGELFTAPISN